MRAEMAGTSAKCSKCGTRTHPNEDRTVRCPECRTDVDPDANAARNIVTKGVLRFGTNGPPGEATVAEREQRKTTLIRTVDGWKIVHAQ